MPTASELDAVTVDAFGTCVELIDPTEGLRAALSEHGIRREPAEVQRAFSAEVAFYLPRAHEGRDAASLASLRRACAAVFLAELDSGLDPAGFAPAFVAALRFRPLAGADDALARLRAAGLALACVSNWDVSLGEQLDRAGIGDRFDTVVSSAEAGAPKPEPDAFLVALACLGVAPGRALHIGDSDADRDGAQAAGLAFAPAPLCTLPARLDLA